jgi:uncharacterized cupin superfamily protein
MVKPLVFDRHEAEFEEYPTPADRLVRGQPMQRTWNHYTSADGKFFSGIWEGEPGCWKTHYTEHEFCQLLSGRVILRSKDGSETELVAGDNFVIPAGFEGEWEVLETAKKVYAIYEA